MATPAGFSSPISGGRSAIGAAVSKAKELVSLAKQYAEHMEKAADAAERAAKATRGGGAFGGSPVGGSSGGNGGGASIPSSVSSAHWINQHQPGSPFSMLGGRPAGFGGGMGAQLPPAGANGGGANIPPSTPRSYEETAAASAAMGAPPTGVGKPNGGGAAFKGIATKTLKAMGGAALKAGIDPETYQTSDWLANRTALAVGNGGYDKGRALTYLGQNFRNAFRTDQEREAALTPIINRGGFSMGQRGFQTQIQGAAGVAGLNPLLAAQAGNIALEGQNPNVFNNSFMVGINTMGRGGKPLTPQQIAQNIARSGWGNRMPSAAEINASAREGGGLSIQMQQMGLSQGMQQSVLDYLRTSSSSGHFLSASEVASTDRGRNRARDSMLGSRQELATGRQDVVDRLAKPYADAFEDATVASTKALEAFAATLRGPVSEALGHAFGFAGGMGQTKVGAAAMGGLGVAAATFGKREAVNVARGVKAGGWRGGLRGISKVGKGFGAGLVGTIAGDWLDDDRGGLRDYLGSALKWGSSGATAGAGLGLVGGPFAPITSTIGAVAGGTIGAGIGLFRAHGNSGDGPGHHGGVWQGIGAGTFRGQEWGDGPGSESEQEAAGKARGGDTLDVLQGLMGGFGGGWKVSSGKRSGKSAVTVSGRVSYHATGNAIDITGPSPSVDSPQLLAINKYLAQYASGINELIYAGPGGTLVKDGQIVGADRYGKAVMDIHHNHVHLAATKSQLKKLGNKLKSGGGGLLSRVVGGVKGAVGAVGKAASKLLGRGKTSTPHGEDGGSVVQSLRARGGGVKQMSQSELITMLLAQGGSSGGFDTLGRGQAPGDPDPAEANAGGGQKSAAANSDAVSMPEGDAWGNAQTIVKVAKEMGISRFGAIIGIATAEQESGLKNLHYGDRDSQGLFQQRPSQGWGTVAEVTNPEHAARSFFSRLKGLDYNHMPLTVAAQKVQRSAYPDAYAKWEKTATSIVDRTHQYGDGPGHAPSVTADIPDMRPPAHSGGRGGGNVTVSTRGGISVGKVEVHLHNVERVSQTEAQRIGRMVMEQIATEARKREMSR